MSLTALDIIQSAQRLIGAIGQGDTAVADESDEGLLALNRLINGMYGEQIGPVLTPAVLAASATGQNGRRYTVGSAAVTLTLPTNPRSGSRIGFQDGNAGLSGANLTVNRGGSLLEGAASNLTISTNGATRSWFFRSDTANWVKETDLLITDSPFFPDNLIAHLPYMLAVYISPEYADNNLTEAVAKRSQLGYASFANHYGRHGRNQQNARAGMNIQGAMQAV